MAEYDVIVVTIATMLIVISLYILFSLGRTQRPKATSFNEHDLLGAIVREFNNREGSQNKKIGELMLRIDLLESKISKRQNEEQVLYTARGESSISKETVNIVTPAARQGVYKLGPVEIQIIKFISNTPKTSREVQAYINRSREHTARLLKRLYQDGYLRRESRGKYFVYSLTERCKQITAEEQPS